MADTTEVAQILVAIGAGGVVVEGIRALFTRRKMSADYADVISASAVRLIAPLEARIQDLEAQVLTLTEDLASERSERRRLEVLLAGDS